MQKITGIKLRLNDKCAKNGKRKRRPAKKVNDCHVETNDVIFDAILFKENHARFRIDGSEHAKRGSVNGWRLHSLMRAVII